MPNYYLIKGKKILNKIVATEEFMQTNESMKLICDAYILEDKYERPNLLGDELGGASDPSTDITDLG